MNFKGAAESGATHHLDRVNLTRCCYNRKDAKRKIEKTKLKLRKEKILRVLLARLRGSVRPCTHFLIYKL